jgi:hypothetical protein
MRTGCGEAACPTNYNCQKTLSAGIISGNEKKQTTPNTIPSKVAIKGINLLNFSLLLKVYLSKLITQ